MFKRSLVVLLLMIPAVLQAADVSSDFDREVNLSYLQTFQFADQSPRHPKDALRGNELADKRMRNAIRDSFGAIGLEKTTGYPDVLVFYYLGVAQKTKIRTAGYGRPLFWGPQSVWSEDYVAGTAIVDFVDPRSGDLIWRGVIDGKVTLNSADRQTKDGMERLARKFKKDREKQAKMNP